MVKAGSGLLTFGTPSSGGVPADFTRHTLVLEYNNVEQLTQTFAELGDQLACIDSGAVCRQYESDPPQRRVCRRAASCALAMARC